MSAPRRRPTGTPKYLHVAAELREHIRNGKYAPGEWLPPEPELCELFGYDRGTVRRGLSVLQYEGLVSSEHGRGTYVRERRLIRHDIKAVFDVNDGATDEGLFEAATGVPDADVPIDYVNLTATNDLADAFKVDPGTPLLERRYLFIVDDGKPHQLTRSYLLFDMIKGTPLTDKANERKGRGTADQLRDLGITVDHVSIDIQSRMPTPDEANELDIPAGIPVLVDRRRSFANGKVVAVADTYTPADRIIVGIDLDLTTAPDKSVSVTLTNALPE